MGEVGERREVGEEMGGMERIAPKVDIVERRREGGALEKVFDGVIIGGAFGAVPVGCLINDRAV